MPATYHHVCDAETIISERDADKAASTFLWFGGHGLVHKGLDLVLDAFVRTPQLQLHICGPIAGEPAFAACFEVELRQTPNITCHDFVSLNSPKFRALMIQCAFVVYASCAEGGSSSVLTVAGNGGLIPVVSDASAIDIGSFGLKISDLTSDAVQRAVEAAAGLSPAEIVCRSRASALHYATENSAERFAGVFKRSISQILTEKKG